MRHSAWDQRAGVSRLGCLIGLLVVALVMYVAFPLLEAELRFRKATEQIRDRAATLTVERSVEVEDRLRPVIRQLRLPAGADRMDVRVAPGSTRRFQVTIEYADTIRIRPWSWEIERRIEARTP